MGFLSKVWKGVKKVFKKIGKGIKKVAMKVGKFMNKIGIVGQIAMAFILPGIGNFLLNGLGGAASSMIANTFGGIAGAVVKGAGYVLQAAHKFVTIGKNAFTTVTGAVGDFVTKFTKTALNKIPGINIESAHKNFFGPDGAWNSVQKDIVKNYNNILNPFKSTVKMTEGMNLDDLVNSTGVSKARIQEMNIGVDLDNLKVGQNINFDAGSIGHTLAGQGPLRPENMRFKSGVTGTGESILRDPITASELGLEPDKMTGKVALGATDSYGNLVSPTDRADRFWEGVRQQREVNKTLEPIRSTFENILDPNKVGEQWRVVPAKTVEPKGFLEGVWQSGKDEFAAVYGDPFKKAPVATTLDALGDIQATAEALSETEVYQSRGADYAPMYVSSSSQDYDVRAAGQPRNFAAYSGGGQYGSTARIYDTILMNPISTWSRDLASRFG